MHVSSSTTLEHLNVAGRGLSIHKNMLSQGRTQVIAQVRGVKRRGAGCEMEKKIW
jgi:hypothetical protein